MTSTQHYVADLFDAVDALDATAFAERFTEDGAFRFGNAPPVVGRQQIEASVAGFFSTISGLKHKIVGVWSGVWEGGAVTSVETTVLYLRKDATVTDAIPVTSTLRMRGDLIAAVVARQRLEKPSPRKSFSFFYFTDRHQPSHESHEP
jgi:SnoaL-like domain